MTALNPGYEPPGRRPALRRRRRTRGTAVADARPARRRGEFVVVAGPSGLGQVDAAAAARRPRPADCGRDPVRGPRPAALGEGELAELRRATLGFVFQQFNLIPTLTAAPERRDRARAVRAARRERGARAPSCSTGSGSAARAGPPALAALGRGAAARRDRARARQPARRPARRRADRQPRLGDRRGDHGAAAGALGADGLTLVLITHDPAIAGAPPGSCGSPTAASRTRRAPRRRVTRVLVVDDEPAMRPRSSARWRSRATRSTLAVDGERRWPDRAAPRRRVGARHR